MIDRGGPRRKIPIFTVVPPRVLLLDIAGPMEVLRSANQQQTAVRFDVTYIGPSEHIQSSTGLALTGIQSLPTSLPDDAVVVVPGSVEVLLGGSDAKRSGDTKYESEIISWLAQVIRPGIKLATICSGALLAARAGLLDGKECTTHHSMLSDLVAVAPSARVKANRLYVEDGDCLTSAGVTAGIDLMLAMITRDVGHAATLAVARNLVIYMRRAGGDPQLSPFLDGRNHLHPAIHRAQDAVGSNPSGQWSVDTLADIAATSPRHLSRLFNEHTGMSVVEYVNRMRIALARSLLVGSRLDMEAIAERVGFSSARQFRRAWNRVHDGAPGHLRTGHDATEVENII
jgi:transcriptional regulator GlxA family with amidase domain